MYGDLKSDAAAGLLRRPIQREAKHEANSTLFSRNWAVSSPARSKFGLSNWGRKKPVPDSRIAVRQTTSLTP